MNDTHAPTTPAGLLDAALAADPARPLLTYYDDATGERVELSATTFANWVAKTANLLRDDLDAEPGDPVDLFLPAHWQTAVWLHACWALGAEARLGGGKSPAVAAVSGPDPEDLERARAAGPSGTPRVALALRPLGARFPGSAPDGFLDYAAEVPTHGDRFDAYEPVDPDAPALALAGETRTGAQVVQQARATADALGLAPGARVLSGAGYGDWDGLAAGLLAPLAAGGSVVLVRHAELLDADALQRRRESEKATDTVL